MSQGIVINPEQLLALKGVLDRESGAVHDLQSTISQQIVATQWEGHVADAFRDDWSNQYAPMLARLADSIHLAGADVQAALDRALAADGQA